ncbi:MAG: 4-(cytidine 5'-diphospho)-2-C-methyl-D-erythritol kinase, partial [Thermodesulfobacteriota bacterium]
MNPITLLSPAKVNLTFEIYEKKPDGYHEIKSIMQPVNLFDHVKIEIEDGNEIFLNSRGIKIPNDESNLAYKAAQLYIEKSKIRKRINISIEKAIPVGSGLGGGSSNAAAVLVGLNRLLNALNENDLLEISPRLGADVAFFIRCKSAFVEGIGEKITPLIDFPLFY